MAYILRTRHVHSVLYLSSRGLFLILPLIKRTHLHSVLSGILVLCVLHQVAIYAIRRNAVNERISYHRAAKRRIVQSTGPVGKLLAAVEVYTWEIRTHPHPINLLYRLEQALWSIIGIEHIKTQLAIDMSLEFFWCRHNKALIVKSTPRGSAPHSFDQVTKFLRTALSPKNRFYRKVFSRFLGESIGDSVQMAVLRTGQSFAVWLLWVTRGRHAMRYLQDEPREYGYHMDSLARHYKRLKAGREGCSLPPSAFGVDMSEFFRKGISRKIYFNELEETEAILEKDVLDQTGLVGNLSEEENPIDHESVFCISYRHLENQLHETQAIITSFHVAANLARIRGKDHFRVWLDIVLRQNPDKPAEKWAFFGLLPYAYYPVIAVRSIASDESERMWLLAEERMGYGNMGIHWIDVTTMEYRFIRGVGTGPEHSFRLYLQYLKSEESSDEKTYHLEDKHKFKDLSDRHGVTDDEQEMYEGLSSGMKAISEIMCPKIWWHLVLSVEVYSNLRGPEPIVDEISFTRKENVPFDGYREWFKHKEDRIFPLDEESQISYVPYQEKWNYQAEYPAAYVLRIEARTYVVLLYKGWTSRLHRVACLCLLVEEAAGAFRIQKCTRVQLKYEVPEHDKTYLITIIKHFGGEVSSAEVTSISPDEISFL